MDALKAGVHKIQEVFQGKKSEEKSDKASDSAKASSQDSDATHDATKGAHKEGTDDDVVVMDEHISFLFSTFLDLLVVAGDDTLTENIVYYYYSHYKLKMDAVKVGVEKEKETTEGKKVHDTTEKSSKHADDPLESGKPKTKKGEHAGNSEHHKDKHASRGEHSKDKHANKDEQSKDKHSSH
ncbi:unnamed protein product [Rotaria magnacalcarata]|uniref:Uncharacterized protein n=1 Tax=Rotaria magnacalcarata TaxID=392030 RepID=A0A816UG79_9BILA|nr:unnamed protein product [Rotaria magnacalcarata]CAF3948256.1 unnamed protein product [Rotaria magnacalcarata]CAF4455550.1 unnamed protein product [Rotaria magnacalcarata]